MLENRVGKLMVYRHFWLSMQNLEASLCKMQYDEAKEMLEREIQQIENGERQYTSKQRICMVPIDLHFHSIRSE